ncbi:MAG TPA: hypothetical protein VG223_02605 [Solirubrobacteraceae bacterium]|jgi:hypothetical protein|nr:hypothetical protein [Solirubrobacteraceae bacterium]
MLLRHRAPGIETRTTTPATSFRHLDQSSLAVLRWLVENRVDFVLVGPVARAIRGDSQARGPVSLVPAPYGRNLDRLAHALWSAHARLRVEAGEWVADAETVPVKLTAEKLVTARFWTLRCGLYDLDIEGRPDGVPRYQELLYEAARFELAPELSIEVASPEDIEHYEHVRKTGVSPEIKITRATD